MTSFISPGDEFDLGAFGYSETMFVQDVYKETPETLAARHATQVEAQALISLDAWAVTTSSNADGSGNTHVLFMSEDDAFHFGEADEITYRYYRDRIPGFGRLAFVERETRAPALTY